MRTKQMLKTILGCLLSVIMVIPTYAENSDLSKTLGTEEVAIESVVLQSDENESIMQATPRGMLLSLCELRITDEGRGVIGVYADTACHRSMSKITMRIYLDVVEDGEENDGWYTFDYYDYIWDAEDYESDLNFVFVSFDITNMDRSAQYRLRCNHMAYDADNNRELFSTRTSFIPIN
ncbi:MAG: hypothetical protein ACRDBO_11020 [Lachnospiraceae bacterium]